MSPRPNVPIHRRVSTRPRALATFVTVVALLATAIGTNGAAASEPGTSAALAPVPELLPLSTSADLRIVDTLGRDVILRGANVNSLGEYWQGNLSEPTTIAVGDADWDEMAARGFSVVRLLITWSRVEPRRGEIDEDYLDLVDEHVRAAAERGIYTVIDMHQDAYSAFIYTTDPSSCPAGTGPAKGWDGAPEWATLTDDLSTCTPGERNASPAVNRAWNNFYDNVDGIRDQFAKAWAAVATRFAGRPEVAGYDILNEPEASRPAAELTPTYEDFLADTITAIRSAEAEAGAPFDHILMVEPALPAGNPTYGLVIPDPTRAGVSTTNIIASVHNYAESIVNPAVPLTIEALNELILTLTTALGVATWGGEYGFWDTSPDTLSKVARYAADEDRLGWGGAWWQWRQSCGDPHHVQWVDGTVVVPAYRSTQLHRLDCPGNVDQGPTEEFLDVLGRAYPRATPGRVTGLVSDPATGRMMLDATAGTDDVGRRLLVWSPTSADTHSVTVEGLTDVTEQAVPGGRLLSATVSGPGEYRFTIDSTPTTTSSPSSSTTAVPGTTTTTTTTPTSAGVTTTTATSTASTTTESTNGGPTTVTGTVPEASPAVAASGTAAFTG